MNVLIISPYFKPYENPRAYRWTQIAEYFHQCGHDVHVLTSDDHKLGQETYGINIHRIGYSTADKAFTINKSANRGAWIPDIIKRNIKRHLWPDESKTWIRPALQTGRQICQQFNIDAIISVSKPFSAHCIAHKLKQEFSIPWLADAGDPFEIGNEDRSSRRRLEQEKDILNFSDAISVTTESLAHEYRSSLIKHSNSVFNIGPMASPAPSELLTLKNKTNRDLIQLGFFGTFYKNVREPDPLIEGINSIAQNLSSHSFELHFFGDIKTNFINNIQSRIQCLNVRLISHPNIPRVNVIKTMQEMDVVLSVGNKNQNQIPSKVVDYVLSLSPILHFAYQANDSVFNYLKPNPLFIPFYQSETSAISKRIVALINQDHSSENQHFLEVKSASHPSTIGQQYILMLNSIVGKSVSI